MQWLAGLYASEGVLLRIILLVAKTTSLLEESLKEMCYEIGIISEFLGSTLRTKVAKLKIGKLDSIKTKGFWTPMGTIHRVESSIIPEWHNVFANDLSDWS